METSKSLPGSIRRCLVILSVLALAWSGVARALAQAPPVPPTAVVEAARHAAQLSGRTLTGDPVLSEVRISIASHSGDTLWHLNWNVDESYVAIVVDQQLGIAVEYDDSATSSEFDSAFEAGQTPSWSLQQAQATATNLASSLPLPPPANWQLATAQADSYPRPNSQTGVPYYWFTWQRFVSGVKYPKALLSVRVEPYNGRVYRWTYSDGAVLVYPVNGLVNIEAARQVADAAYLQYMGASLRPGDPTTSTTTEPPEWDWVTGDSPYCRQVYFFDYSLPNNPDPNYDPETATEDTPYNGHPMAAIVAQVDAETGELFSIGSLSGGFGGGGRVHGTERMLLLRTLYRETPPEALAQAVAVGKPARAVSPSAQALRFTREVKRKTISFAFNKKARRLTWQTDDGNWTGLALPEKQAAALAAWLKTAAP